MDVWGVSPVVYCACLCVTSAYRVWPRACGTVLQMALVIAARYSELPPESAAPPCVRGDRGRIQPIRSSLPSGAQPVADQLCSGLWAHKAPFLSCNWCLARVDVVFLLKFDVLTYHN